MIYNPFAGKLRRKPHLVDQAHALMTQAGHQVHLAPTTGPRTAGDLARECIARGADLVVAAGGDGTINEVMNGVVHSQIPLMVLPGGSANVLALELGVGGKVKRAVKRMGAFEARRIAVGEFTGPAGQTRYFLLMAGIGFDAYIVHTLNPWLKSKIGKAAYWVGGFGSVLRFLPEFDVRAEGFERRVSFALISRVRNYGGDLEIAKSIRLDQPEFELVTFEGGWSVFYLKYFLGVLTNRLDGMTGVTVRRGTEFEVGGGDKVLVQLDGEAVGPAPARFRIVPDALTLLVPPTYGRD